MARPTYANVDDLKGAADIKATAYMDARIYRALQAGADQVDSLCNRVFYPVAATRYFDWPGEQRSRSWRLWLNQNELVSVSSLVAGGTTIPGANYFLEPNWGPPYNRVEIDLSSSSAFAAGDTHQRAIAVTGVWAGAPITTTPAGALAEALDASETGVDVTDSSLIGIGDLVVVDDERMLVTGKSMLDTAVNIDAGDSLTASMSDVSITMSTTTGAPAAGETILIGSERMLVVDVAGSVLTVKRGWDGSVLAAHSANADIYAPRTLTVTRGAYGTTAATHSSSTAVSRHAAPGLLYQLNLAEAIAYGQQDSAGWARTAGAGEALRTVAPEGLPQLREQVVGAYGRQLRTRAV